jgi:hypothetical protein
MKLVVATPVGGAELWAAQVTAGYSGSLYWLSHEMSIEAVVDYHDDVVRSRNRIAAKILRDVPLATHVLWWDADQWPEDRRIVPEMMATGEDVISAPYTNKNPPLRWTHNPLPGGIDHGDWVEARHVSFGFTITTTSCLRRMSEQARVYTDWPNKDRIANIFGQLYDPPHPGGAPEDDCLLSEDYSFCKRWRDMGGRVVIYRNAGIIHHAGGHIWNARQMQGGVIR